MGLDITLTNRRTHEEVYWRKANMVFGYFVKKAGDEDKAYENDFTFKDVKELLDKCKMLKKELKLVPGKVVVGMHGEETKDGGWEWVSDYEDGYLIENKELAEKELPLVDGFFFGIREYSNFYMNYIDETIEKLGNLLAGSKETDKFIFYASY